jgi:cell wall-associated NlpC family hydrolase
MAITDAVARINQIESLVQRSIDPATPPPAFEPALTAASPVPPDAVMAPTAAPASLAQVPAAPPDAAAGSRALAYAEAEVGQGEEPPGSNDGPRIALYRSAVAGAVPGDPWCADFVSWAAQQAGAPIGDGGTGLGSVAGITDWAQRTGRLLPAGAQPQPGDLILFGDQHVGMVESVAPDGSLTTVEGNYAQAVSRVHRSPYEATGYVRLS